MMKNYTIKKRPRRAFGKRPPAPRKPKGKPGRPFVGAHGGGSGRGDRPWVHSPRAEGPGLVKVGGQARSPGEGRGGGGGGGQPRVRVPRRGGGGRLGWPWVQSGVWSVSSVVLERRQRGPHPRSARGSAWVPHGFRMGSAWVPQRVPQGSAGVPRGFRRGSAGVPQGFRRGSAGVPSGVPHGCRHAMGWVVLNNTRE